jgi:hypothetical protein
VYGAVGPVAQRTERRPSKSLVGGSIPSGPARSLHAQADELPLPAYGLAKCKMTSALTRAVLRQHDQFQAGA